MTPDPSRGVDAASSERRDADARYNAALTALDRAIAGARRDAAPARDDIDRITTALIVFLQQITAFVDTKDREVTEATSARLAAIERHLESIGELRTQITVLQRALDALERAVASPQSSVGSPVPSPESRGPSRESPVAGSQSPVADDYKYVAFEDEFRGSDEVISGRLAAYVPLFERRSNVLDIGCGRGEFLSALAQAGIPARGVDANREMAAIARARGLDAIHADALEYLMSLADASLDGVIATQVVEHLQPSYLGRVLETMAHKLRPGAPVVIETINPACWLAFFSSYIRDLTHVRPVHPETLQYLLRASGFERVELRYSAPVPEQTKMTTVDLPSQVVAGVDPVSVSLTRLTHAINANAVILNNLMFTHLDYAAIGYRA